MGIMAMILPAPAPAPTVGEVMIHAQSGGYRAVLWMGAVCMPCYLVFSTAVMCYTLYRSNPASFRSVPWRLPPLGLWAIYMALLSSAMMHAYLFLPRAPYALCRALLDVGGVRVGVPLGFVAIFVAFFAGTWIAVAVTCIFVAFIAGVLDLWVWLVRTYGD